MSQKYLKTVDISPHSLTPKFQSMEDHKHLRKYLTLLFLVSFVCPSSPFSPSDNYLIHCGAAANVTFENRLFIGDSFANSDYFYLSANPGVSAQAQTTPLDSSPLHTARVFTSPGSYEFKINSFGTHVVRLHFFAFSSHNYNLSSAIFHVSALGFSLLGGFSVPEKSLVLKEFLIEVDVPKLVLSFTPSSNSSSIAFINAIEVFSAPDNLIANTAKYVTSTGFKKFNDLRRQSLETVYRINVGGPKITSANDTLWRNWNPDDNFLLLNDSAKAVNFNGNIMYQSGGSTPEIAPEKVYDTARQMNNISLVTPRFNVSWIFPVSTDSRYFVRMHFCDFVSQSATQLYFDVYINGWSVYEDLHPSDITLQTLAAPFYVDFITDADQSGILRVSIGPSDMSEPSKVSAILNGLEIMKMNKSAANPDGFSFEHSSKKSNKKTVLLFGSILGGVACIVLVIVMLLFMIRSRKSARRSKATSPMCSPSKGANSNNRSTVREAVIVSRNPNLCLHISFAEIKQATDNFNEHSVIGSGGFGKVYSGVLSDGTKVAVKRGMPGSKQGLPEFQNEIMVLSRIRHRHLVSLVGYCQEQSEMILVYEFVEKGPLKKHLYVSESQCLSWKQRLEICIGAAKGIHYLHTGYTQGIIHRDVKSSNILLDEEYQAKVADFGLSKLGPTFDQTHVSTAVKGSFGYLDPEYYKRHQLTDKSDVYSFGVVLLEVLCARPVISSSLSREEENIVEWAMLWQQRGLLERIIDQRLVGNINSKSLKKYWETAQKCLADHGVDRPTIGDVLWNLEYALQLHETEFQREPHEDSTTQATEENLPAVRRAPSTSVRANNSREANGPSETTTNQIFSQLMTYEGR